ncbi:DNA-binding protein ABF1 NDAI_0K01500 [Naumovozyma dairenensis CBS 421]|uniref:Uncharacterized protein n=1 Tax=Naumovozyma dairenensis (strain ATCC 10597 / BCRC 20456 / CBS 421 / NBRC 0211 / NRRL Y-12639) TaxID=1071378 RepID=G0WHT0_NAUDC|nr:hypothetical protein NDAI_0K01500 [Naumovozyma dairenensis CBS 421]CCD27341.1 hypothetical protein NDAI_0K01500 [Naumovozyma dairenensis CBS 421]
MVQHLYEYKHAIINKSLDSKKGKNPNARSFKNLKDWYSALNDYEFQSRCPIVLKNSHEDRYYTFICSRKHCPFKIILAAYIGERRRKREKEIRNDRGERQRNGEDDFEDAIDAAIASVRDPTEKNYFDSDSDSDSHPEFSSSNDDDDDDVYGDEDGQSALKSYYMVNSIEPFHNHPLDNNMTLRKFVLTKISKILQYDLNFDAFLQKYYKNEEDIDDALDQFSISSYVETSGLLNILKDRYGMSSFELDKKMISEIGVRVAGYKSRFLSKWKKELQLRRKEEENGYIDDSDLETMNNAVKDSEEETDRRQRKRRKIKRKVTGEESTLGQEKTSIFLLKPSNADETSILSVDDTSLLEQNKQLQKIIIKNSTENDSDDPNKSAEKSTDFNETLKILSYHLKRSRKTSNRNERSNGGLI